MGVRHHRRARFELPQDVPLPSLPYTQRSVDVTRGRVREVAWPDECFAPPAAADAAWARLRALGREVDEIAVSLDTERRKLLLWDSHHSRPERRRVAPVTVEKLLVAFLDLPFYGETDVVYDDEVAAIGDFVGNYGFPFIPYDPSGTIGRSPRDTSYARSYFYLFKRFWLHYTRILALLIPVRLKAGRQVVEHRRDAQRTKQLELERTIVEDWLREASVVALRVDAADAQRVVRADLVSAGTRPFVPAYHLVRYLLDLWNLPAENYVKHELILRDRCRYCGGEADVSQQSRWGARFPCCQKPTCKAQKARDVRQRRLAEDPEYRRTQTEQAAARQRRRRAKAE